MAGKAPCAHVIEVSNVLLVLVQSIVDVRWLSNA